MTDEEFTRLASALNQRSKASRAMLIVSAFALSVGGVIAVGDTILHPTRPILIPGDVWWRWIGPLVLAGWVGGYAGVRCGVRTLRDWRQLITDYSGRDPGPWP